MRLYPEATRKYVTESGRVRTPATAECYQKTLRKLQSLHPRKEVHQFKEADLVEFCLAGTPAPNTVKLRRTICTTFFAWCQYQKLVQASPAVGLSFAVSPGNFRVRMGRWLSDEEVGKLLRSCDMEDQCGRRDRLILMFGFFRGLRRNEIASLRWPMFSKDLRTIDLVGKGQKLDLIHLPEQLHEEVVRWHQEIRRHQTSENPPVFFRFTHGSSEEGEWDRTSLYDCPLGFHGIAQAVRSASRRAKVPCSPHDMRRTFAGHLERSGKTVLEIQRGLRHTNLATTSRYMDQSPAKSQAVVDDFRIEW
ncbi:MAG TPA: site-specific integrase [Acidimicrobiia bacterium]|nr:site-specific integrase [Acidimicrobiia bacterium]